jgi:hypothetical protein
MPIKLPDSIVYYSESEDQPGYVLCWIPRSSFSAVARDDEALEDLEKYHPNGIEIQVDQEALEDAGIHLPLPADDLRKAYAQLSKANVALDKSRRVAASVLEPITEALRSGAPGDELEELLPHLYNVLVRLRKTHKATDEFRGIMARGMETIKEALRPGAPVDEVRGLPQRLYREAAGLALEPEEALAWAVPKGSPEWEVDELEMTDGEDAATFFRQLSGN